MPKNPYGKHNHPPPKPSGGKKKPDYYWRFRHKFDVSETEFQNISLAAKNAGLDVLYFAAIVVKRGYEGAREDRLRSIANQEAHRANSSGYRNQFVNVVTSGRFNGYKITPYSSPEGGPGKKLRSQNASDPYFKINGKVVKVEGQSVRQSDFLAIWSKLNNEAQNYLGRNLNAREVVKIAFPHGKNAALSQYERIKWYMKKPAFTHSPLWKGSYRDYVEAWNSVYGNKAGIRPPKALIKQALLNHWDPGSAAWQNALRNLPQYQKSVEFQDSVSNLSTVYHQIMGTPNDNAQAVIHDWAMKNKSVQPAQAANLFAAWLRSPKNNPGYANGYEQRVGFNSIAASFGINPDSLGSSSSDQSSAAGAPPSGLQPGIVPPGYQTPGVTNA